MAGAVRRLKHVTKRAVFPLARLLAPEAHDLPIECWDLSVGQGGALCLGGRALLDLAREFGTPTHVLSAARLDSNLAAFRTPAGREGRRAEVFFSFKTQPLPWIIQRLLAAGAGAEVISEYELRLALHLGATGDRIIFNGPGKSDESIRMAVEANILSLNINHLEEVDRVAAIARSLGRKVRVGVRAVTSFGWSSQFGCSIASGEAMAAFERARACPELDVVALHSHRGSHIHHAGELEAFASELLRFADAVQARLGISLQILDFGGSLGVPTVRSYSAMDKRIVQSLFSPVNGPEPGASLRPEAYARALIERVEAHFAASGATVPRVVVEPGRAITADAQALLARVMTLRSSPEGIQYAVLDAGINIAGIIASERHQVFRVTDFGAPSTSLYRLVGPICQPGDTLFHCVKLPHLAEGDVLLIMDSGAYFEPDSTSFSFPRPPTVALDHGAAVVIRRRESFTDMLARDLYGPPLRAPDT